MNEEQKSGDDIRAHERELLRHCAGIVRDKMFQSSETACGRCCGR
jgi:hypothetical protein